MEKTTLAHKSEVKRSNWQPPTHSRVRQHSSQSSCSGCGACHRIARSTSTNTNASASLMLKSLDSGKKVCATRFLQRTYGNRYVQRLIQAKKDSPCLERCGSRTIQMKASGCCGGCANGKEEEGVPIQTKLTIGRPGDKYEQEADRVADTVMRMPEPEVQRQPIEEEEEELQMQAKPVAGQITPLVQRQPMEEEEEELQAKEDSGSTPTPDVTPDLETGLNALQGGGQPLPEADRSFMERRFGVDFSGVRAHTDSNAMQMSRGLNAEAFTHGKDIYFGAGRYSPGTSSGKRLLAHEMTHVVQQNGGPTLFSMGKNKNSEQNSGDTIYSPQELSIVSPEFPVIQRNQSEWYKKRQDWRYNWCMNNPDSQHRNDIPACRQEVEKWTGQPYYVPHYDEDNSKPGVITPGKDNDTTADDDSDGRNVLNEGGSCSTKQTGGRTVTAPDSKQIPIPDSLRVSPDASINVTGTFPNYDVVAINPASMSNDTKGILKVIGVGLLGGGVKKLLSKKGLGRIAAWVVSRPAAIVGSVVFSLFNPVSIAREDHVRTKYCDGMNVKYTIIGGD